MEVVMNKRQLFVGVIAGLRRVSEQEVSDRLAEEERRIVAHSIANGCPPKKAEKMLAIHEREMDLDWFLYLARIFREDFVPPSLPLEASPELYEKLPV
jgi:hypothetical protein